MFQFPVFICILLFGFPYLTSSIPAETSVSSGPRSVLEKIPLDKWAPAIDKIFGKVEDWRPIGVKSVRIVSITTGATGSPTTTTMSTTTTTTSKPTTTSSTTTTTRVTTTSATTTTTKPTTTANPTTTTTKPTTTSATTTTIKPTITTTTDPRTSKINQQIRSTTASLLRTLATPQDIINRVKNGEKSNTGPSISMGNYPVECNAIPHKETSSPPTLKFEALDERKDEGVLGAYVVVMFDQEEHNLHYMTAFTISKGTDGTKFESKTVKTSKYVPPAERSYTIFTFITFKKDSFLEGVPEVPDYEWKTFYVENLMQTHKLTVVDATAAMFI